MPNETNKLQKMLMLFLVICVSVLSKGCVTPSKKSEVIFVPQSNGMVRLADDVTGHVYIYKEKGWVRTEGKVKLPAGWYAGSLEDEGYE